MSKLVEWLKSLPRISNVEAARLVVEGVTYDGAVYDRTDEYTASMAAVVSGDKKAGDTYTERFYYFLGNLPKSKQKKPRSVCYTFNGDTYYIAGYTDPQSELKPEYNPFGRNFLMKMWPAAFGEIDRGERYVYKRIPIELTTGGL